MRSAILFLVTMFVMGLVGCSESKGKRMVEIRGAVEKGPFLTGSTVLVTRSADSDAHLTRTINDEGEFAMDVSEAFLSEALPGPGDCLSRGFIFESEGFYYNEITGELSHAPIVLRSMVDSISDRVDINTGEIVSTPISINILTHLTFERSQVNGGALACVGDPNGACLEECDNACRSPMDYALGELMIELSIGADSLHSANGANYRMASGETPCEIPDGMAAGRTRMVGGDTPADAYLFAVSAIFIQAAQNRGGPMDATLQELLNTASLDLADDGHFDQDLIAELRAAEADLDTAAIEDAFRQRLLNIGSDEHIPHLDTMIDWDRDGEVNADDCMPHDPDRTTANPDFDNDGFAHPDCGGNDCDDSSAVRHPGATEVCDVDDVDEDCDPSTFGFRDADGDGAPDAACCNEDGNGGWNCGTDCDDNSPRVCPGCPEVPDNGVDDDCDGIVDAGNPRWDKPAGAASIWIVVDDTANATYGDGELKWFGSFGYDDATNLLTNDAAWGGPFPLLYDDGPWTAGGHEAIGQVAGDHQLSAEAFVMADAGEVSFEYGIGTTGCWLWGLTNGSVTVPAGSTDRIAVTGMSIPAFGDIDFRIELDTAQLHADFLPFDPARQVWLGASVRNELCFRSVQVFDDGLGADATAGDGIYTMLWSDNLGAHDGLVSLGDVVHFRWVFDGPDGERYEIDSVPLTDGVAAFSNYTGDFSEETIELLPVQQGTDTAITIGP